VRRGRVDCSDHTFGNRRTATEATGELAAILITGGVYAATIVRTLAIASILG
jgi:hypothetical protein